MIDLLRIMTAGSVDDGKSTLIGRMLYDAGALYDDHIASLSKGAPSGEHPDFALLTDGLRAEREQGITIDVAYRYFATPRRRFIIADAPGHEQYTRNMATAASTADLAILLIDARQGVSTQSRRHAFICALLGVPRLLVAVNKMDLVGFREERFREIEDEYRAFAVRLGLKNLCFIPVCAVDGDNLVHKSERMPWYGGPCLLPYLEDVYVAGDRNLVDFRLPVQRVVRPDERFRGYSGTLASGVVRVGDEVIALPSGFRSSIRSIHMGSTPLPQAVAGQAVTVCLDDELDIARGDLLVHPGNVPREFKELDLMTVWTGDEHLVAGMVLLIKLGCQWVKARCELIRYRIDPDTLRREQVESLGMNDIARIRLVLYRPVFADPYARNRHLGGVLLVSASGNDTVGAATIVERTDYDAELKTDRAVPERREVVWHHGQVTPAERTELLRQKPLTIWFTGLSGAGKSTLAFALERRLVDLGMACYVLDGDNVRHGLNRDLGFSPRDRAENIRRIAEVSRLMNDAGLILITAFISPFQEDREMARGIIGTERFLEVYLETSLEVCEARDPKGMYRKARSGELPSFTGISSPYEQPERPDLKLDTASLAIDDCVTMLLTSIRERCVGWEA
ncbi:adenylyl-sulfate kinase [Geobacter hydrogenophilus]|uniref:Adenylyl-sulfate kinase n=1 Tax=Geobacter hydrogenophilus TaxID=40983 RepID=A0A9W6G0J9_9BACT|nr:adenylyl-sulfate kinase [Geobacter hydrogenophilus]MBT0893847.1 adenylyl-sulfate kinase [Geobacter hydrogenophilus]GLI38212.1 adenylyl-sulfate kinase [Geobacter hydrogenophilus]